MTGDGHDRGAPWYLRLGAWVGIGTGPGALMSGGGVAEVTGSAWLWVALTVGAVLLTGLAVANAFVGQRRRAATAGLAARAFGSRGGPRVVSALIAIGTSLWTGFYIGVAAGALGYLLNVNAAVAALPVAGALLVIHRSGFERWNLIVGLTGGAALAVGVLVFFGIPGTAQATGREGAWTSALVGAGVVVAYAAVFSVRVADFTWDARRGRDTLWAALTLLATLTVFLVLGAGIFLRAGSWELADLVNRTRVPAAGASLLALSIVAPAVSGLHSAALALRHLFDWPERWGAVLSASVGAILGATRFDLRLVAFLDVLGAVVPPVLPVLLLRSDHHRDVHAWLAWASGATVGLAALAVDLPAHVLLSIAVSGAVMVTTRMVAGQGVPERSEEGATA